MVFKTRAIMSIRNATTTGVKLTKNVQYIIYAELDL